MEETAANLRAVFDKAGQGHVFKFYEDLDDAGKKDLLAQLASVDVDRCNRIFKLATAPAAKADEKSVLEPLPDSCFDTSIAAKDPLKIKEWETQGCELINKGEV